MFCGSKFCSPAESRYHPIEGEALAATYGLQKCKFFILGLENLILTIDHKPLIAIFGMSQNLEEIENPRLLNFKLKSLMFWFKVMHIPGKKNATADTFSRRFDNPNSKTPNASNRTKPAQISDSDYASRLGPPTWVSPPAPVAPIHSSHDPLNILPIPSTLAQLLAAPEACEEQLGPEDILVGNIMSCLASVNMWSRVAPLTAKLVPEALSWKKLEAACLLCETYRILVQTVQSGAERKDDWDEKILDFYSHRNSLVVVGPVVLLHDRPVIPMALRQTVLAHLHAGHQGANTMFERASTSLYWPNFAKQATKLKIL